MINFLLYRLYMEKEADKKPNHTLLKDIHFDIKELCKNIKDIKADISYIKSITKISETINKDTTTKEELVEQERQGWFW